MQQKFLLVLAVISCCTAPACLTAQSASISPTTILLPIEASRSEILAAHEVRRYAWLRTGKLLPISSDPNNLLEHKDAIIIARKDRALACAAAAGSPFATSLDSVPPQCYWIKTIPKPRAHIKLFTGGDDAGTLYAACRFAEILGVRFYLHGDVVPEEKMPLRVPVLGEQHTPLFALRGIQPFHDFLEGPDRWNLDDYLAIVGQLPNVVRARLQSEGNEPAQRAVLEELYEGIFRRIQAAYPLDFYWFWTPEGWTWEGTKWDQVARTTNDLSAALAAYKEVQPSFALATCGWVLGPQQDRALFDKVLPKSVTISCINRQVGKTPVNKGFAEVQGRGKWAIPWLEDDGKLPRPVEWVDGPVGLKPDTHPWNQASKAYAFVDEFAALENSVRGSGNRERFQYWLNTFRYMRVTAELRCAWGSYNAVLDHLKTEKDPVRNPVLCSRPLGHGTFSAVPFIHVNRGVYTAAVPTRSTMDDFEYYVKAEDSTGNPVFFPAGAPGRNQTVVVIPDS